MKVFDYNEIDEYQIEITSFCNAACPQCPRNNNGYGINPYLPVVHLSRETIDAAFTTELCQRLNQIFFCGSYGDPIMHPNFLEILRDFRKKNNKFKLYIHTNGGLHGPDYWKEIAHILSDNGQIDFGIDGLADTLHLYRKNVNFEKVIKNAKSFIDAGGNAQWNFIVFKHNEHQVEEARELSKKLGFNNILVRNTGRFFNHEKIEEMDKWPVYKKEGQLDYFLETPINDQYRNKSMRLLPSFKQEFKELSVYFKNTNIKCDALSGGHKKVTINAEGVVLPCNFFNHNLYDRRFRDNALPGANSLSTIDGVNQVRKFLEKYGLENLNISKNTLEDIFLNKFWEDLANSWSDSNRLFECAMTCGDKITKVWDQGGSNR